MKCIHLILIAAALGLISCKKDEPQTILGEWMRTSYQIKVSYKDAAIAKQMEEVHSNSYTEIYFFRENNVVSTYDPNTPTQYLYNDQYEYIGGKLSIFKNICYNVSITGDKMTWKGDFLANSRARGITGIGLGMDSESIPLDDIDSASEILVFKRYVRHPEE